MNDERVAKILDWLADRVTKAENFVLEQAPDVVQQIIAFDMVHSIAVLVGCILGIVIVSIVFTAILKTKETGDFIALCFMGSIGAMFVCTVIVFVQATHIAQMHVAPKAYLLQRVGVLK